MHSLSSYSTDRFCAGGYANSLLYRLCEIEPQHTDAGIVAAKAGLIGSFYSASPKRGIGPSRGETNVDFFDRLGSFVCRSPVDDWLDEARQQGSLSCQNLHRLADIHRLFDQLIVSFINNEWNRGTSNRTAHSRTSFSSKYLHFHVPGGFPIYDSVILQKFKLTRVCYADFCDRFIREANSLFGEGKWNPRLVDMTLYPYKAI